MKRRTSGSHEVSRRSFLSRTGRIAAAGSLAGVAVPCVHAAEDNTIRLALVGCGGRGSGAAGNAFEAPGGPVKLVAMADLFHDRLAMAHKNLTSRYADRVDVPEEQRFVGFDAYRHAIDCLRPGDIAMLTGYAAFRPAQLEYAVRKEVNVFMEKSFACDPPGVRRVIQASEAAEKKNLKVAAGLMARHSRNRQELIRRIREGELGPIQLLRAYRMHPCGVLPKRPSDKRELDWQIRNFTHFLWVSGGLYAEMNIHQVDEICWVKGAYPVSAHGVGGRAPGNVDCGQNLDSFSIEWTFADGTKAYDTVRWTMNCHNDFGTYIHGTKCAGLMPWQPGHREETLIYKDQRTAPDNVAWKAGKENCTHWQAEWNVLLDAIRNDRPHNEARRAALVNLADIMGRAAVHSGRLITWDEAMASNFRFCPNLDAFTFGSPAPVQADAQGRYPVPIPGKWSEI